MQPARALAFDFNGTLSHDEPLLFAIYAQLFAEHGRPLTEADYFGTLAGNTEEAIISTWLGVDGSSVFLVLMTAVLWFAVTLWSALRNEPGDGRAKLYYFLIGLAGTAAGLLYAADRALYRAEAEGRA